MITRLLLQSVFLFLTVAAQVAGGGRFADENGNEQVIETTDSHPFWVVTGHPELWRAAQEVVNENGTTLYHENLGVTENGYWDEAKDLREGDVFIGANGELSTLVEKERVEFPEGITVYNFTVDGNHDYFVIAQTAELGQTSVLVHNADYTQKSANHVYQHGHAANSYVHRKGRFLPTEGGQKLTDEVLSHPNVISSLQPDGRICYTVNDIGRYIGYNRKGILTKSVRVIVEGSTPSNHSKFNPNEVVTQFPLD
jgi:hypothetical protein